MDKQKIIDLIELLDYSIKKGDLHDKYGKGLVESDDWATYKEGYIAALNALKVLLKTVN